jgi:hypothetical protein
MNDSKHSKYEAFAEKWYKTRSACEGQTAVHNAGEKFLPRLSEQTDHDYRNYKMRATYFNATGRTLEGLVGMVFRKEIQKNYPTALEPMFDDMDLKGNSLDAIAMFTITDLLQVGRAGILVEYPSVNETPNSLADAARANLRPYTTYYPAESILDWRITRVNNVMQPVMIKLQETYEIQKNEFEYECKPQIRALLLTDIGYIQRIYRRNEKGDWVQFEGDIIPLMKGQPIPFIPFWAFGAKENSLDLQEPPILDLADLNIAHYRVTADYERGCHFAGLPTPILAGFVFDENEKVSIGASTCITSTDPSAKWGFLEFTGQGLGALEKNLLQKESQMAAIGARMLAPEKAGVESAGTLLMRSNGEASVLAALVELAGENFEQITRFMAAWYGVDGEIELDMNKDFMPVSMTSQELDSLMKAWQVGGIPKEELFYALKQGEVIRESTTYEEYQLGLEADATNSMDGLSTDEPSGADDNTGLMAQIRTRLGL